MSSLYLIHFTIQTGQKLQSNCGDELWGLHAGCAGCSKNGKLKNLHQAANIDVGKAFSPSSGFYSPRAMTSLRPTAPLTPALRPLRLLSCKIQKEM